MNYYQLFEKYLAGKMSTEEQNSFKERLKSDPETRKLFEDHLKVGMSFDYLLEKDVQRELDKLKVDIPFEALIEAKNDKPKTVPLSNRLRNIAAVAVILIASIAVWNSINSEPSLFNKHYVYLEDITRSDDQQQKSTDEIKLDSAKKILNKKSKKEKDFRAAILILENLVKNQNSPVYIQAKYNLALSYLDIDAPQSKRLFSELQQEAGQEYQAKIKNILLDLE